MRVLNRHIINVSNVLGMLAVFVDSLICTSCNTRDLTDAVMLENGCKYEHIKNEKSSPALGIDPGSSGSDIKMRTL